MARVYTEGDSPYITVEHEVYSFDTETWALTDPTSIKITIIDPDGNTKVDAANMDRVAEGKYEYIYTLPASPATGWWRGYIDVVNGSRPDREWFGFTVK